MHFSPEVLFKALQPFSDPFEFYHASGELNQLQEGFQNDIRKAKSELPVRQNFAGIIYQFQNQAWCRRVSGVYRNQVTREAPRSGSCTKVRKNYAINFPEGVEPQQQESTI